MSAALQLPVVVSVTAAGVQEKLVDAPVLNLLAAEQQTSVPHLVSTFYILGFSRPNSAFLSRPTSFLPPLSICFLLIFLPALSPHQVFLIVVTLEHIYKPEGEDTQLLHDVEFSCLVEVKDVWKKTRVPVKIKFIPLNVVVVTHLQGRRKNCLKKRNDQITDRL